jgi:prepilin-type N-terminal cleavage/methylation domain-containing protein
VPVSGERGYTLVELLVAMTASLVVLGAILTIVQVSTHQQDRVAEQVAANQRARPAMTRIIDRLHSACVSPGLAPVQEGSDGDTLILLSKAGEAVSPIPDKYVYSLSEGVLSETVYPGTGGEPGEWTFGSPSEPRQVLDGVSAAEVGEPPESVPVFRYYAYEGGEVSDTPLPTSPEGLSETNAARTVQVDVAFTAAPNASSTNPSLSLAVTDSATLRIEPASEDSAEVNRPCV